METAHIHLGKPWKSITYHTSSFAMPTTGMCSPFKTNSGHCQSPHCFRCWWFILWLAWGWREEKERKLESKRGATFPLPHWKPVFCPWQHDLQRGPPLRVAWAVSSEGEPRGQGETPPLSCLQWALLCLYLRLLLTEMPPLPSTQRAAPPFQIWFQCPCSLLFQASFFVSLQLSAHTSIATHLFWRISIMINSCMCLWWGTSASPLDYEAPGGRDLVYSPLNPQQIPVTWRALVSLRFPFLLSDTERISSVLKGCFKD